MGYKRVKKDIRYEQGDFAVEMTFELRTEKSMDEVRASLLENLQTEGFGVLWEFDIQEKLQEKGVILERPCRVLEICNPSQAKAALDINPDAAYFLPCKIAIMEKVDGLFVGMLRPALLMELLGDEEVQQTAHDVERHMKRAIMESV